MCLDKIDEMPSRKFGVGYKILKRSHLNKKLYPLYYDDKPLAEGIWLTTKGNKLVETFFGEPKYPAGYHLYPTRTVAKSNIYRGSTTVGPAEIHKAKFRKVIATVEQAGDRVIVAREIMLLEEV